MASNNTLLSRRHALKLMGGSLLVLTSTPLLAKSAQCLKTPAQTEGPFYPVGILPNHADLTQLKGRKPAQGKVILVKGKIFDQHCRPLANAQVDIWQANHFGRYRHPNDPNKAKLDPGFDGAVRLMTDKNGEYSIKTIVPGAYPAADDWVRPPHIHFKVSHQSKQLTTQMYFPGNKLNQKDAILNNIPDHLRKTVIARQEKDEKSGLPRYLFDVTLA